MSEWEELTDEKKQKLLAALQNIDLLVALGAQNIAALLNESTMKEFAPGEIILLKGEISEALYIIGSGKAVICLKKDPKQLGGSQYFGEMSLFLKKPVTCTIKGGDEGVKVLALPGKLLVELISVNRQAKDLVQAKMRERGIGDDGKLKDDKKKKK